MNQQEAEDIPQKSELPVFETQEAGLNDNNNADVNANETTQEEVRGNEEWEVQRDHHKALADAAFRAAEYPAAIQEYTNAITLDPDFHILYSNRSAAHLANGEKSKALADAKKCVLLKPDFVKGHNRLAASMMSLGRWNEARSVYMNVLSSLDKENEVAKKGLEDCRLGEQRKREAELEMIRLAEEAKREAAMAKENSVNGNNESKKDVSEKSPILGEDGGQDEEDDLLNEFFDEVEDAAKDNSVECAKEDSENDVPVENKIQIQLNDLGDTHTQIQRLLRPNHEWYNLNPFKVLDISHEAPIDMLSRRYKALSLLLHPDKVKNILSNQSDSNIVEKAQEAFEYVRKAMNSLKDETKAKYFKELVEQGLKQGKKDYENHKPNHSSLEQCQEKAVMKIFAEIERKRRDVERRKRNQEKREREHEDAEKDKLKKEFEFEKKWKNDERVEKRIGNWRDFNQGKRTKY
jgi:Putative Zn-dependent protease, contains TPR repeats